MAAKSVQGAVLLLCLVMLAALPRVAQGNCRDNCMAACYGWPIVCQLSCGSACLGEVGISTLSTSSVESPKKTGEAPASAPAPAPAAPQEGGGVSVLRGLKPSPARGDEESH